MVLLGLLFGLAVCNRLTRKEGENKKRRAKERPEKNKPFKQKEQKDGASKKKRRLQTGRAAANEVTAIGGGSNASFIKTYHLQNPGQIVTSPFSSLNEHQNSISLCAKH